MTPEQRALEVEKSMWNLDPPKANQCCICHCRVGTANGVYELRPTSAKLDEQGRVVLEGVTEVWAYCELCWKRMELDRKLSAEMPLLRCMLAEVMLDEANTTRGLRK